MTPASSLPSDPQQMSAVLQVALGTDRKNQSHCRDHRLPLRLRRVEILVSRPQDVGAKMSDAIKNRELLCKTSLSANGKTASLTENQ